MTRALFLAGLVAAALSGCQTVGSTVGRALQPDLRAELADSDVALAVATLQTALETADDGTATGWTNPETGHRGTITPTRTYQTDAGFFCRSFSETLVMGARTASYDDAACRGADGVWRLAGS